MIETIAELEEAPKKKYRRIRRVFGIIRKIPRLLRHQFRSSKKMVALFVGALLLNGLLWGGLAYLFQPQEAPIFLHYNIHFGIDLIGPWWRIFSVPLTGLIIILLNLGLSAASFKEDRALSFTVMTTTVLFQIFLFAASFLIVTIN